MFSSSSKKSSSGLTWYKFAALNFLFHFIANSELITSLIPPTKATVHMNHCVDCWASHLVSRLALIVIHLGKDTFYFCIGVWKWIQCQGKLCQISKVWFASSIFVLIQVAPKCHWMLFDFFRYLYELQLTYLFVYCINIWGDVLEASFTCRTLFCTSLVALTRNYTHLALTSCVSSFGISKRSALLKNAYPKLIQLGGIKLFLNS